MKIPSILFALTIVISSCGQGPEKEEEMEMAVPFTDTAIPAEVAPAPAPPPEPVNWSYSESKDEMTGNVMYFAECSSTNSIQQDFPYEGDTRLAIIVREKNNRNAVLLAINKGQFMSSYSNDVRIKFDDKELRSYGYSTPDDGTSGLIFLEGASGLIKKLKTAKTLKIQPGIYQAGTAVFDFDVAGLEWKH
ncbi:MAG TPA: hypothetical protein VEB40_15585 [Flavipsychrobacter sp.]|nr:hypothetical protein [Flavipsychrobacter sp.]